MAFVFLQLFCLHCAEELSPTYWLLTPTRSLVGSKRPNSIPIATASAALVGNTPPLVAQVVTADCDSAVSSVIGAAEQAGLHGGDQQAYVGNTPIMLGGDLIVELDESYGPSPPSPPTPWDC